MKHLEELEPIHSCEADRCADLFTQQPSQGGIGVSEYSSIQNQKALEAEDSYTPIPPQPADEVNGPVFRLARELRADVPDLHGEDLERAVESWWREQSPESIRLLDFEEVVLPSFFQAWATARFPAGYDPISVASQRSEDAAPPECAARFASERIRRLITFVRELQDIVGDRPFFLSGEQAGGVLGLSQPKAWGVMRQLENAGIIRCVKRGGKFGDKKVASRYVYTGDRK